MKQLFSFLKEEKLTRKEILFLSNSILFCVMTFCFWFKMLVLGEGREVASTFITLLAFQCIFTFLSLIVYYLSIIANTLERKNNTTVNTENSVSSNPVNPKTIKITAFVAGILVLLFIICIII